MATDVMVDLETLGRVPGAVIVSLGAVKFDPAGEGLDQTLYTPIAIQSGLDAGLSVDGATIQWWLERPEEVRQALFHPDPLPLRAALSVFTTFYAGSESIWSHGSTFDIPILEAAYRALRHAFPWSSKAIRDTRTLFGLVPRSALDGIPADGPEHHALYDSMRQARMVQAAHRWLKTARERG